MELSAPQPADGVHGTGTGASIGAGIGVLITNLGTPQACTPAGVRRYLREFLWDPRVVEMPRLPWWLILHLAVLTTRPRKSAKAYQKIWYEDGSPLLVISRRQQRKLQRVLGSDSIPVGLAMRYGSPSMADAIAGLQDAGVRKLLVLPLYPQYCAATTGSTFDALSAALARRRRVPAVRFINHYHDHPGYINALADGVRSYRQTHGASEVLLMSFHGIPKASAEAGDPYPAECHLTAQLLAEALELEERQWRVSFQSRFGPKEWLQPYTDHTLAELARGGTRSVQVVCPGFSADCLETLEEIAIQNRAGFVAAGGTHYGAIPCLNDSDAHIRALADIITDNAGDWLAEAEVAGKDAAGKNAAGENQP